MNSRHRAAALVAILFYLGPAVQARQMSDAEVSGAILARETQFWEAYNACNVAAQRTFFDQGVEFYHDKGGVTLGAEALTESLKNGLCSGTTRTRREAVANTVRAFPMRKDDAVYGAIVSGEHLFYTREQNGPETLAGRARFTTLWLLKDGEWKMRRVLSYDHGPATGSPR